MAQLLDTNINGNLNVSGTSNLSGDVTLDSNINLNSINNINIGADTLLDIIYPIGSIYTNNSNTNPSATFGGTWVLVNKLFTPHQGAITATLKSGATSATIGMTRDATSIRLRINIVNKVALTDTTVDFCQLPLSTLGVSNIGYTWYGSGISDNGNTVCAAVLAYDTGLFQHLDVFNVDSLAAGKAIYYEVNLLVPWERRLDSACDRFIWERTA